MQIVLCAARPLTIIAKWEWPERAKNRGEPQKMTPSSETENFLGVVPMGKLEPRV